MKTAVVRARAVFGSDNFYVETTDVATTHEDFSEIRSRYDDAKNCADSRQR
jgi:hypothetical protein